ncbi:MAG: hypothetical protein ACOC1F_01570 [Myxococcota bacterium]
MRDQEGVQGYVTRWGQEGSMVDVTPYEQACRIHGGTTLRSWSGRWLRAVPNDALWVGAASRKRLDPNTVNALGRIGAVTQVGPSLRVELPDDDNETVRRLEEALQALLPSEEEAHAAPMAACRPRARG